MSQITYQHNIKEIFDLIKDATIDGDIHKLKQVIRNIISNALKFTKKNGSVIVDFTVECKDNCGSLDAAAKEASPSSAVVTSSTSEKDRRNKHHVVDINDDSNKMGNEHFFLVMSVKDSGPGITKVPAAINNLLMIKYLEYIVNYKYIN